MRRIYTGVFILCLAALLLGAPASADGPAVADVSQMTAVEEVVEPGMVPVYPESLRDGDYPVELRCSSSMFRVTEAVLHVRGGEMSATLYMHSKSYLFVYPGTAPEADAAPEAERIPFEESGEGEGSFTIPVAALDAGVPCAAYSRSKELWYDRTLLFRADSLPEDAFREGFFVTAESLGLLSPPAPSGSRGERPSRVSSGAAKTMISCASGTKSLHRSIRRETLCLKSP